ncbi:MAG TPA: HlyD family efflux transporter periplasmic adaptor subunit [Sandaracinaceae bacterium LLY-WYZ-13_1]|nr:HlyD family efflux transporter periplasmic adaptor subunit [Sandaracinaceae bacterium LLY-WYZ-13_1]
MGVPFERSTRSLARDSSRRTVAGVLLGVALVGAWAAWAWGARVELHETSERARLETLTPPHPVEAPVDARVAEILVELGQEVTRGQALVRLESDVRRTALREATARRDAIRDELPSLRALLETTRRGLELDRETTRGAVSEMSARAAGAEARAALARERASRVERLATTGAATPDQRALARAEAERRSAEARASSHAARRARWERLTQETDRRARLRALEREIARVEGALQTADARVERLRRALARHVVVAPIEGRVAEMERLARDDFAEAGDHLLSVLPDEELRAVAYFSPGRALGRIEAGQPARMRLEGFPWTRFGTVDASVRRVAAEPSAGTVRVELELVDPASFPAPLQHGHPGHVEVRVEEVSPFDLLLRSAGRWLEPGSSAT